MGIGKALVKFYVPFEEGSTSGYALDVGPRFFLLALVDERIRFNGFQCLRLQDVRRLQTPATYAAFKEAALAIRGERVPDKPSVCLDSIEQILLTASRAFPLVCINREKTDPSVCEIGRVVGVGRDKVTLLKIDPDAVWDYETQKYKLGEITRVDFGGGYEEALILAGGEPETGVSSG